MHAQAFFEAHRGLQRQNLEQIHKILIVRQNVRLAMRYHIPFYFAKHAPEHALCYVNPGLRGDVELMFLRGRQMSDPFQLMDLHNRRAAGILITIDKPIPQKAIEHWLDQAVILENAGYSKRASVA